MNDTKCISIDTAGYSVMIGQKLGTCWVHKNCETLDIC